LLRHITPEFFNSPVLFEDWAVLIYPDILGSDHCPIELVLV
jgi:hypothetical protein